MIDFISKASNSKIKVYCKPFNPLTVHLMSETYKTMEIVGGDLFECSNRFDKGMSYELLEKCQIVLWDQPGTGFLECIACGIPTMVLLASYYMTEEWTKDDFLDLEEVGVIHRESDVLINEVQSYLLSPSKWMDDPERKKVIKKFAQKYALSDEQWWKAWRSFFAKKI